MENCIFCKIVNKEIPAKVIYEDHDWLAFLDIKPINLGHTLLVPKQHYQNLYDTPNELLVKIGQLINKLARAIKQGVSADGINIGMNNERAAGQLVMHTHLHIIPRFADDGLKHWPGKENYNPIDFEVTGQKIKLALN